MADAGFRFAGELGRSKYNLNREGCAAEDGSLSQGEIFSNEATVSDLDHLPEGPWAPSDAREAQRISGKSVTSPRQGMAR